jgi:arginine exporter protein ArgO
MRELAVAIAAGAAAGLAVAMPLGPIGVMIVDTGIRNGFRTAFSAGLGTAAVDGAYAAVAALFGAAVGAWLAPAESALRIGGACVLGAIALAGLWSLRRERGERTGANGAAPPAAHVFARFVALTAVNPLTAVTFAALMLGLPAISGASSQARIAFVAGAFAASLAWQTLLAGGGAVLRHRLPPGGRLWTALAGQLIVLALAVRLALG